MFFSKKKTAIIIFISAVFLLLIDRFLKILALNCLCEYNIIGEILNFNFTKNYYIAFSLPLGGDILLVIILIMLIFLLAASLKLAKKREWIQMSLFVSVLLGAISNFFDRLQYGYVIDYIDLKYFTVFNVADVMIVCSFFLLFLVQLIDNNTKDKNKSFPK